MKRTGWLWGLGALLLAAYVVPYTLLAGIGRWHGAFLFWLAFGILVWGLLSLVVWRWNVSAVPPDSGEAGRGGQP
ncbi:hypothetical protein [Devosia sp.]|uniref:hypothetical protein n=1 Tax=Devosia sp. TaxID=1871048 RepID=UPI002F0D6D07